MSKLTRAEKNAIIMNEAKGIQHPLYYVFTTKSGTVQVRKRKQPLSIPSTVDTTQPHTEAVEESVTSNDRVNYDQTSNKELLLKMLSILENNAVSRDENLNAVENERVTEDNKQYIESITSHIKDDNDTPQTTPNATNDISKTTHRSIPVVRGRRGRVMNN